MMSSSGITFAADVLASLLNPVVNIISRLSVPVLRLYRLASLRAQVIGLVPVSTQFDGPVQLAGNVSLVMGEHVRLGRDVFLETCGGKITLGSHVRINSGVVLVSYSSITIGNDCLIGEYVSIRDADHGITLGSPMRTQVHTSSPVTIGDDVWIARGVVILKGVKIGNGAVIAANSVVNRDVPPNAIVGGIPARLLKMRANKESAGI